MTCITPASQAGNKNAWSPLYTYRVWTHECLELFQKQNISKGQQLVHFVMYNWAYSDSNAANWLQLYFLSSVKVGASSICVHTPSFCSLACITPSKHWQCQNTWYSNSQLSPQLGISPTSLPSRFNPVSLLRVAQLDWALHKKCQRNDTFRVWLSTFMHPCVSYFT